jgi:hypothetical protein
MWAMGQNHSKETDWTMQAKTMTMMMMMKQMMVTRATYACCVTSKLMAMMMTTMMTMKTEMQTLQGMPQSLVC